MSHHGHEGAPTDTWHYLGPASHEAEALFDDANPSVTIIAQGHELIVAEGWATSKEFVECGGIIFINEVDGATLVKHVGPTSKDLQFRTIEGLQAQEAYTDFAGHALVTSAAV
jgi:hypothetical protein